MAITSLRDIKPVPFDDALAATGFGKLNYALIFLTGITLYNIVMESLGISFILPVSECDLDLSVHEKGALSTISFIGMICSSYMWGFLADTTGRRRIIRPTSLIAFVITVLSSISPNFLTLLILRFLNGIFISASSALIYAYLGEFHTNKIRNRVMMFGCFVCSTTSMLFPLIAWIVINQDWSFYIPFLNITYKPWRFYFIVNGLQGLLVGLCLFKIPESPKYVLSTGDTEKTLQILRKIYAINTGRPEFEYPIEAVLPENDLLKINRIQNNKDNMLHNIFISMWQQSKPLLSKKYIGRTIILCCLQFSTFIAAQGIYVWFPEIINAVTKFTDEYPPDQQNYAMCEILDIQNANIFHQGNNAEERICTDKHEVFTYIHAFVLEVIFVAFFVVMGSAMRIMKRTTVLFLIMSLCGICGIFTVVIKIPLLGIYLYVAHLLAGLGNIVTNTTAVDLYPTNLRGMAMCITLLFGRLGCVIGSNVSGILLATNCEMAFYLSGGLLFFCGFLVFLLPKPKSSSEISDEVIAKDISTVT